MTLSQTLFLYNHYQEEETERLKFLARIHGIDVDTPPHPSSQPTSKPVGPREGIFRDPSEYEKLTPEERQKLTEEMMGMLRPMVTNTGMFK